MQDDRLYRDGRGWKHTGAATVPSAVCSVGGGLGDIGIHAVYDWRHPVTAMAGVILMEFGDFAMMRRMLIGIKARAESLARHPELVADATVAP